MQRRKRKLKKGSTARALALNRKKSTASRLRAQPLLTVVGQLLHICLPVRLFPVIARLMDHIKRRALFFPLNTHCVLHYSLQVPKTVAKTKATDDSEA